MKPLLLVLVAFSTIANSAEQANIYPLRPDGSRGYTKQVYRDDGKVIYALRPDGSRDYTKPAYRQEGKVIYQLRPDGTRDYTKPALSAKKTSQ